MPRKQKKYHYIYKTTNILNNKFYIGMHSTDNLNDGYIGSGKRLWYSINKHGKENHKTEILEYLLDRESLKKREEEIVNKRLLDEDMCMNLTVGGRGDWGRCNEVMTKEERIRIAKIGYIAAGGDEWNKKNSNKHHKRLKEDSEYRKWYRGRCKAAAQGNAYWNEKKNIQKKQNEKCLMLKRGKVVEKTIHNMVHVGYHLRPKILLKRLINLNYKNILIMVG